MLSPIPPRIMKEIKDCQWECMITKVKDDYYKWEMWTHSHCGFYTPIVSQKKYGTYIGAKRNLIEFIKINSITKYEAYNKKIKKIFLNDNKYAIIDLKNYKRVMKYRWYLGKDGNVITATSKGHMFLRRLITGGIEDNILFVGHINKNKLDNREKNLKIATYSESINKIAINNKSGYKGVSLRKATGRWCAKIKKNGKHYHIGYFDSPEEASVAYEEKVRELRGEK